MERILLIVLSYPATKDSDRLSEKMYEALNVASHANLCLRSGFPSVHISSEVLTLTGLDSLAEGAEAENLNPPRKLSFRDALQ